MSCVFKHVDAKLWNLPKARRSKMKTLEVKSWPTITSGQIVYPGIVDEVVKPVTSSKQGVPVNFAGRVKKTIQ